MRAPDDPLDPQAFAALPREVEPPAELEERVVAALRDEGLLREKAQAAPAASRGLVPGRLTRWRRPLLRLAASLAIFVSGLALGRYSLPETSTPAPAQGQKFLLLLYEPRPLTGGTEAELIVEYQAWAHKLAQRGQLLDVKKLRRLEQRVEPAGYPAPPNGPPVAAAPGVYRGPTGYFLVIARDLAEAEALARDCPHLAHGGEIAVHPVDRVQGS